LQAIGLITPGPDGGYLHFHRGPGVTRLQNGEQHGHGTKRPHSLGIEITSKSPISRRGIRTRPLPIPLHCLGGKSYPKEKFPLLTAVKVAADKVRWFVRGGDKKKLVDERIAPRAQLMRILRFLDTDVKRPRQPARR